MIMLDIPRMTFGFLNPNHAEVGTLPERIDNRYRRLDRKLDLLPRHDARRVGYVALAVLQG